jgi:urease subunit alpha
VHYRLMFGALGGALAKTCVTFVSGAAQRAGVREALGLQRQVLAVRGTRDKKKQHMIHNAALPRIEVDAQTYEVRADGELLTCEPANILPLAQKYFLF